MYGCSPHLALGHPSSCVATPAERPPCFAPPMSFDVVFIITQFKVFFKLKVYLFSDVFPGAPHSVESHKTDVHLLMT